VISRIGDRIEMMYPRRVLWLFVVSLTCAAANAQQPPGDNLALGARATASSFAEDAKPDYLVDGDIAHTQWKPKDGSNLAEYLLSPQNSADWLREMQSVADAAH
jgi:hypothetical protein